MTTSSTSTTTSTPSGDVGKATPVSGTGVDDDGLTPALAKARENEVLTPEEEFSALNFLLGPVEALQFDVPATIDTPVGKRDVTIRIRQLDPTKIEEIDNECRRGDTALARIDQPKFVAHMMAAAGVSMKDATGETVSFTDERWIISAPPIEGYSTGAAAFRRAFKYNGGVLDQVVDRIQAVSGFEAERVGVASRVLTEAAKGL